MKVLFAFALFFPIIIASVHLPDELVEITSNGVVRQFILFISSAALNSTALLPLVINYHGWNSNPEQQRDFTMTSEYAEKYGWAVAYPQGIDGSWNAGACCGGAASRRVADVQFARDIVQYVGTKYGVLKTAVFSMGFSNGGFMSHRLACEASDVFRAVSSNSGRRAFGSDFQSCEPKKATTIIAFQGTSDYLVPIGGNPILGFPSYDADMEACRKTDGCDLSEQATESVLTKTSTSKLFRKGCELDSYVDYITVQGAGHTWFTSADGHVDTTAYSMGHFASIIEQKPLKSLGLRPRFIPELARENTRVKPLDLLP